MTYAELKALNPVGGDCVQLDCEACTVCGLSMECNPCYSIDHARLVTDRVREIIGFFGLERLTSELEGVGVYDRYAWLTATPAQITLAALLALAKRREENVN